MSTCSSNNNDENPLETMSAGEPPDSGVSSDLDDDRYCTIFENRLALSQDLRFLMGMPEFCDVLFLVGEEREQVYGVKAIMAIRSRVFFKLFQCPKNNGKQTNVAYNGGNQKTSNKNRLGQKSGFSTSLSNLFQRDLPQNSQNLLQNGPSTSSSKTVIEINDFEPDVFKQLLEYLHTGSVALKTRTLLGLINAAEHFGVEDLRKACADFSQNCINLDTVCPLLVTAERYIQYKSTKNFIQKVLEFVDQRADQVLKLNDFVHLPLHVVELIMSRCKLNATDLCKYRAADRWSRHQSMERPDKSYRQLMIDHFVKYVNFHLIPTPVLMREIRHLNIISDRQLMNALAYQADPYSLSPPAIRKLFHHQQQQHNNNIKQQQQHMLPPKGVKFERRNHISSNVINGTPLTMMTSSDESSTSSARRRSSDDSSLSIYRDQDAIKSSNKRLPTVVRVIDCCEDDDDDDYDEAYCSAVRPRSCLNINEIQSAIGDDFKF